MSPLCNHAYDVNNLCSRKINSLVVAAIRTQGSIITGVVENKVVEIMIDSGSSISLVRGNLITGHKPNAAPQGLLLVSAAGEPIPVLGQITLPIQLGDVKVDHSFIVVQSLITPVILGIDFMQKHGLVLDFTTTPITIRSQTLHLRCQSDHDVEPLLSAMRKVKMKVAAVPSMSQSTEEMIDDCAIPIFDKTPIYELPKCSDPNLLSLVETHKQLFNTSPGRTTVAKHFIPTMGNPVKIPPRRVPANYHAEVQQQINSMLQQGIIEPSSSPWMAPAVFVRKKNGEVRICVDYRELNKRTTKDAYPLPRPDEVQDRLKDSTVFSTLDLRSGYWQLPVHADDQPKTAFCPGPGFGLFQFRRMPFGLSGAPSSFQRLMNTICGDLSFVTTYLDDLLVHSKSIHEHVEHLEILFQRMHNAGLTFRGSKCQIGMPSVTYLGHIFSETGMSPAPEKVSTVHNWPPPTDVGNLRSFLGLASYYRRYIHNFADIAAPLYHITNKGIPFVWDDSCQLAFTNLKNALTHAPILKYPDFSPAAKQFQLYTDASAAGIGAVLEQCGHVIAYASRTLSDSEKHYSVIQKECLAVVHALKQFRHYLLGREFSIITDHAPLQWLSAQKMEGLLARWALAIQEYDFTITYRKGLEHGNADALSWKEYSDPEHAAATTQLPLLMEDLRQQQLSDPVIYEIHRALSHNRSIPPQWHQFPLSRYKQLWSQLCLHDGLVCRQYTPSPNLNTVLVPLIPESCRSTVLYQHHDSASATHLGFEKTSARVRQVGYWVGMLQDIEKYCRECTICQCTKPPKPTHAPLTTVPIGRPWEMVAVDVLEVPVSQHNNRYLLVIQDYMTKWAEAIPIPNQTAGRITKELIKVFSRYGIPDILHSDQGKNFESTILRQTLDAFGITKSRTTAYHPAGDGLVERFNRSLLQMLRAYVLHQNDWEQYLPLVLYAYRTAVHTSTGVSPFELMFGRCAHKPSLPSKVAHDVTSYQHQLQAKLSQLMDFVEAHNTQASSRQKQYFDQHTRARSFVVGDPVWLSIPTAGKLDPRWEGEWIMQAVVSPTTYTIHDGYRTKTVHIDRLRPRLQAVTTSQQHASLPLQDWTPPAIEHHFVTDDHNLPASRYPTRERRPPDRYRP